MKNNIVFAVLLILLSSVFACEFQLEGEYYVEIEQEINSSLSEYELTAIADDEFIVRPKEITYSFEVTDGLFYLVVATLDEKEIYVSDLPSGSFILRPGMAVADYGFAELVVNVYTSTNTNSLADQVQAEAAIYQFKKRIRIDKRPAEAIPFTITSTTNALTFNFQQYPNNNLWRVNIYGGPDPDQLFNNENQLSSVFEVPSQYIDLGYVGGTMYYGVETQVFRGDIMESERSNITTINLSDGPKIVKYESTADGHLKVYWSRAPFESSFSTYTLKWLFNGVKTLTSTNFNDTTASISGLPMGDTISFELVTTSANQVNKVINSSLGALGDRAFQFDELYVDRNTPSRKLSYDASSQLLRKTENEQISISLPVSGLSFSNTGSTIAVYSRDIISLLNFSTLTYIRQIELNGLANNSFSRPIARLQVIDDRYIAYTDGVFKLLDYVDDAIVYQGNFNNNVIYYEESKNLVLIGRDFSGNSRAYKAEHFVVENGTLTELPNEFKFMNYTNSIGFGNYVAIVTTSENKVNVLKIPEMESIAEYTLGTRYFLKSADPTTNWGLFFIESSVQVRDMLTGTIIYSGPNKIEQNYALVDGILYSGNGFSLNLNR